MPIAKSYAAARRDKYVRATADEAQYGVGSIKEREAQLKSATYHTHNASSNARGPDCEYPAMCVAAVLTTPLISEASIWPY